jgi:uncharacterized membrane protein HdeD (DUF308 family)
VNGVIEIFTAAQHREMHGRGWRVFMGILSTIAGLILLAIPGISLVALVVVVSVWLILFGLLEISFGLRLRSGRAASARPGR